MVPPLALGSSLTARANLGRRDPSRCRKITPLRRHTRFFRRPGGFSILGARICHRIQALAFVLSSQELGVTVSVGISCMDTNRRFDTAEMLVSAADEALYEAKSGGGNRVSFATHASSE